MLPHTVRSQPAGAALRLKITTAERRLLLLLFVLWVVVVAGCGSGSAAAPASPVASPAVVPLSTSTVGPQPTFTPRPTPTPVPSPTKGPDYAMLVLRWAGGTQVGDVDDVMDIGMRLQTYPGIIGSYGDDIQITITYDPAKTNPAAIQRALSELGYQTALP